MRTTLRTLVTLTTTAAALLLPAAATAAVPAGSCEHPLGADRANVAYQWKSRSNAWRIRPALVTVKTTTGPGRGAKNGTLTQSTEHTGIEAWYLVLNARQVGSRCYLQVRLPKLHVVAEMPDDPDKVRFGAWVTLEDEDGNEVTHRIVGADEFDPTKRWISIDSPVARALLGHGLDDEITVTTPTGSHRYWITDIRYQ